MQLAFLLRYGKGIGLVWWLSTAGTLLHAARGLLGAHRAHVRQAPLRRMAEGCDWAFGLADGRGEGEGCCNGRCGQAPTVRDARVEQIAERDAADDVRRVGFERSFEFSGGELQSLARSCRFLRELNLSYCGARNSFLRRKQPGVTEAGLLAVAKGCPQLRSISPVD